MNSAIDVIIIEDNELLRVSLKEAIAKSGSIYCEHSFGSGEAALELIEKEELVPDIILLDIGLPGLNGIELIPELKKLSPSSKILIITVHDDDENVFNAICAGASGYLLKDLSSEKIVASINEVMNGGAPMNSHIAKKVLNMFRDQNIKSDGYGLSDREKEILSLLVDGLFTPSKYLRKIRSPLPQQRNLKSNKRKTPLIYFFFFHKKSRIHVIVLFKEVN
jgi:DNA-binding NarL/FixJ family response regulator